MDDIALAEPLIAEIGLHFDLVTMQDELTDILGCEMDLLTREGVEQSHNLVRREAILRSAQPIYRAA